MARTEPAFTRLDVEERRRLLLEHGRELFTSAPYDELSMAAIAKAAGISKALLYHYFPSKQAFFRATLQDAAVELAERVNPNPEDPPGKQLHDALASWLEWVDENSENYGKTLASGGVPEVRELIDEIRGQTEELFIARLLTAGGGEATPQLRAAIWGWMSFMDGACLYWVTHGGFTRGELHELLMGTMLGALAGAGRPDLAETLRSP